jgi:magnesium chelatase family protein
MCRAVKESRDRVSTALTNSWFKILTGWTTINLAPADVKKEGLSFRAEFRSAHRHARGQ